MSTLLQLIDGRIVDLDQFALFDVREDEIILAGTDGGSNGGVRVAHPEDMATIRLILSNRLYQAARRIEHQHGRSGSAEDSSPAVQRATIH